MEDVTKNMNDLFAMAKNAKVEYPMQNITSVINSAAATTGAVGGTASFFNLSNIAIMLGSIFTVVTIAVVVNTTDKPTNQAVETPVSTKQEVIIEKKETVPNLPMRKFVEITEVDTRIELDPEEPIEEEIIVEEVLAAAPSGSIVEEQMVVSGGGIDAFHSIHLNISADVTIVKGSKSAVNFKGDTDLAQYLDIEVTNGVLRIGIKEGMERQYKRKSNYDSQIELVLTMNEIKSLVINGSGDIYSPDDIRSDELIVQINGSGDVKLDKIVPTKFELSVNGSGDVSLYGEGNMASGEININGSGDVCTKSIDVSVIDININGSGDVNVSCKETLNIDLLGSGDVCYSGSPEINVNQMGSGDIHNCQH